MTTQIKFTTAEEAVKVIKSGGHKFRSDEHTSELQSLAYRLPSA